MLRTGLEGFGMPGLLWMATICSRFAMSPRDAVQRAREGGGPTLIEAKTIRWERHSAFAAGKYASPEEAQQVEDR